MLDSSTRRGLLRAALVSATLVLATACTNAANDSGGADGADGSDASTETRTVTDARGEKVEVPADPQRVVALSEPTLDAVLTLGVEPVGAAAARGQTAAVPAYLAEQAGDVPVVGALGQPDLEQILELDPDLILIDGTAVSDQALIKRLDGIATTLWVGDAGNADWRDAFSLVGEALDRSDEAAEVVTDYEERTSDIASRIRDNVGTVSVVRWGLASGGYLPPQTFPGAVVADVGLARPATQVAGGNHSQPVSMENIEDLDADWMFFCTLGGAANPGSADDGGGAVGVSESEATLASALDLEVGIEDLAVHRADQIVPVDGSVWGSAGGAGAALALLDDLDAHLT